ncbi:hypothetical protein H4R27_004262 [Coemansia aciculifera]|nr:hypothetical protein H4R27_004262 [Coemansia aciculifera]
MRLFGSVSGLLALVASLSSLQYPASAFNFTRRNVDTNRLANDYRGAQLLISSTATSCELGVIDSSAVFVAASCLALTSSGREDNSIDYIVAIHGIGGSGNGRFSVESIILHPQYNPTTLANNIAILKFKKTSPIAWYQPIGYDRQGWNDVYYSSRTLSNPRTPSFNSPSITSIGGTDDGCNTASNLYSANKDIMLCVTKTTTSSVNGKCQLPYGAAWGVYQPDDVAIGALYSHSVVYGSNNLCGNPPRQYHYYLMLQPFTAWAAKELGRPVKSFAKDSSFKNPASSSFQMNSKYAPGVFGTTLVAGDMFPSQRSYNGGKGEGGGEPTPAPTPSHDDNNNGGNNGGNGDHTETEDDKGNGTSSEKPNKPSSSRSTKRSSSTRRSTSGSDSDYEDSSLNSSRSGSQDGSNPGGDGSNGSLEGGNGNGNGNGGQNNNGGSGNNGGNSNGSGGGGSSGSHQPNKGGSTGASNTGGMSRSATIAVATVVPIVTILIMVGLFFAYKWWRKRQNVINWDPKNERANLDRIRIIDEITTVTPSPAPQNVTPPSYLEHEFESIFNPVGKTAM